MAAVLALALATGLAGELSAAEAAVLPGPELTGSSQVLQRLPSAANPAAESLSEMPIAETAHPTGETGGVETAGEVAGPDASPLTTAEATHDRSVQLEQVAQQADRQTRHGFELAGRGAYFAARSEFIGALRLVAEGLDAEQKTDVHSRALAAALLAIKEAEDFLPGGSRLEANLDMPGIIAAHATPVLKTAEKVTPLVALRHYLTFAQEQFAAAAGSEVAGSMALHAMGKLHAALAQKKGTPIVASESKAMVFYQAALLVYPKNYMAANDLGVLLAQCGRYADARAMLEHSLSLCPQSTGWQNLAVVYRQLGQTAQAQRAAGQAMLLRRTEISRRQTSPAAANDLVRWVDPQAFAQTSTNTPNSPVATPRPPAAKPQAAGTSAGRPPAATNWPAPTPAAAGRMSRGAPAYQR